MSYNIPAAPAPSATLMAPMSAPVTFHNVFEQLLQRFTFTDFKYVPHSLQIVPITNGDKLLMIDAYSDDPRFAIYAYGPSVVFTLAESDSRSKFVVGADTLAILHDLDARMDMEAFVRYGRDEQDKRRIWEREAREAEALARAAQRAHNTIDF